MRDTKDITDNKSFPSWRDFGSSSFWMPTTPFSSRKDDNDVYKLAANKRAISNFVTILTGKNYPVTFNTSNHSYTDGNEVVIGADITSPKDFDVATGLALHEASHLLLSKFDDLHNFINYPSDILTAEDFDTAEKCGIQRHQLIELVKNMWNYVEDRRIDNYVFSSTPGYRDYYRSMYDRYFNSKDIDAGLLSDNYTDETLDSYMFRVINLHNPNSKSSKLKGLLEIYKEIDLMNISRLKSTTDTRDVAYNVTKIILKYLDPAQAQGQGQGDGDGSEGDDNQNQSQSNGGSGQGQNQNQSQSQSSDDDSGESPDSGGGNSDGTEDGDTDDDGSTAEGQDSDSGNTTSSNTGKSSSSPNTMSKSAVQRLKKQIEKQKQFLDGDVDKKKLSKEAEKQVAQVEEAGVNKADVGEGANDYGSANDTTTELIEVTKVNESILKSDLLSISNWGGLGYKHDNSEYIKTGIQRGTMLGKRLQVRGEVRNTEFNRQRTGKIDKRMISALGFGVENVFKYNEIDTYKKANLHISLDLSSSMNGAKWNRTVEVTSTIVKAVSMISNLEVQVSLRSTKGGNETPLLVWLYDSKKDKLTDYIKYMNLVKPSGTTPEGLCFEQLVKHMIPSSAELDSYFLNISDGEPYMGNGHFEYYGQLAHQHTKDQVSKMRQLGIGVLSYFMEGGYGSSSSKEAFKTMYGTGSAFIDTTSVGEITKTLNSLFLKKK